MTSADRELVGNRANLNYPGARVAAAHYAVLLADSVRERAQSRHGLEATFSKLHYFSLFRSGQQLKPAGESPCRSRRSSRLP